MVINCYDLRAATVPSIEKGVMHELVLKLIYLFAPQSQRPFIDKMEVCEYYCFYIGHIMKRSLEDQAEADVRELTACSPSSLR